MTVRPTTEKEESEVIMDEDNKNHNADDNINPNDTDGELDDYGKNSTIIEENDSGDTNETGSLRYRYLTSREKLWQNQRQLDEIEDLSDIAETNLDDEPIWEDDDEPGLAPPDPNGAEDSEDDAAEAAEKAAIEAAKAAENAAAVVGDTNSSSTADNSEVVAAMNEATKAANKAKDASVAARSKISAEALLSGDGELMTSVLSNCFSDLKYGIRKQEEIEHDVGDTDLTEGDNEEKHAHTIETRDLTFAYIYLDGDVFIRLNLTAPYWGTVSSLETVPAPHYPPEGKGDLIDWAIFMLILMGTLFGFLVLVHNVGIVIDKRLRFRHVFHPTMSESEYELEEGGEQSPLKGGGFLHSELRMTLESIPTSMGGGGSSPPTVYRDENGVDDLKLDIEMAKRRPSPSEQSESSTTPTNSSTTKVTFGSNGTPTNELPASLRRKRETPDHVEYAYNKSHSKIALPKQSPRTEESVLRRLNYNHKKNDPPPLPLDDS